jgi:hypothetical protein
VKPIVGCNSERDKRFEEFWLRIILLEVTGKG